MSAQGDWLFPKIMDFITVLHECLAATTHTQDRSVYADDIATAAAWLVRLHQGGSPVAVAKEIVDSSTTKHFTDYWRQGEWGELEAQALKKLQEEICKKFGEGQGPDTGT